MVSNVVTGLGPFHFHSLPTSTHDLTPYSSILPAHFSVYIYRQLLLCISAASCGRSRELPSVFDNGLGRSKKRFGWAKAQARGSVCKCSAASFLHLFPVPRASLILLTCFFASIEQFRIRLMFQLFLAHLFHAEYLFAFGTSPEFRPC